MKKLILLFALFCSLTFGQSWNTTVTTSITEPNIEKIDLFTNASGNHVLLKEQMGTLFTIILIQPVR